MTDQLVPIGSNASLPVSVRVIRNFTVEAMAPFLKRALALSGLSAELSFGGFATASLEISQGDVPDTDGGLRITVLALGLEEASPDFGHVNWPAGDVCAHILAQVRMAVASWKSVLCINTVLAPLLQPWRLGRGTEIADTENAVITLNSELRSIAQAAPGRVILCDWEHYARMLGEKGTYDYRFWYSNRAPFAAPFLKLYAQDISKVASVLSGRVRKCLVLDCDNTLWGGIVGEDGMGGIQLGNDAVPGRYFYEFQRSVLDLAARGVILALCSKNNEADAMLIFDEHPDCAIRRSDLAGWRINWHPKNESLVELARELNIGLDSFVFVDDSPAECELIRQVLPEVAVVQVPERLEQLPGLLLRDDLFGTLLVTDEDRARGASYRHERERRDVRKATNSAADYLAFLETRLQLRRVQEVDLPRVAQLFQRTNQFNLTTRRHDEAALREMLRSPDKLLLVCEVADRFGSMGLTGAFLARRDGTLASIESLLLSCRVLGRDAEFALVSAAAAWLQDDWATQTIEAEFVPSAKNAQCADFLERCGFASTGSFGGVDRFRAVDIKALITRNKRSFITTEVTA